MLRFLLSTFLILSVSISIAQRTINGKVIGLSDKAPLSYANIGIRNSSIGTLSNEDGSFSISIPQKYEKDTLTFSALGFSERSVPITTISGNPATIDLTRTLILLREVVISSNREKAITGEFGNRYWQGPHGVMYADSIHAGAAMALLITPNVYPSYPEKARVRIQGNSLGTCKIRLRLLKVDSLSGLPGEDLLHENVIIQSDMQKGWLNVDLKTYNITINSPFYLTVEWIIDDEERNRLLKRFMEYKTANPKDFQTTNRMVDGKEITDTGHSFHEGVLLGASGIPYSLKNYKCFYRTNSFGEWKRSPYIVTSRITLSNQPSGNTTKKMTSRPVGQEQQQALQLCEAFMKERKVHGIQLAVSRNGKLVLSKGLGLSDKEKNIPVTNITRFKVGSISKALTAAALIKLVEEHKLDLDAPIQTYVPTFPRKKYDITTRELAGHLAGIRHYKTGSQDEHYKDVVRTEHYASSTEAVKVFQEDTLLFKPGTRYFYSSFGWSLIGAVIEGASGQNYLDYMQKNIWKPLNMQHTLGNIADSISDRTEGYYPDGTRSSTGDPSYNYPGAGLLSTAEDLALYGDKLLYGSDFKPELVKELFTSQHTADEKLTGYGLGWNILKDKNGHMVYFHRGSLLDDSGYIVLYPDDQLVIAFLANSPEADKFDIQELGAIFYNAGK